MTGQKLFTRLAALFMTIAWLAAFATAATSITGCQCVDDAGSPVDCKV
jgi:hypothetical protein